MLLGYLREQAGYRVVVDVDLYKWLRRGLRLLRLKQWRRGITMFREARRLCAPPDLAQPQGLQPCAEGIAGAIEPGPAEHAAVPEAGRLPGPRWRDCATMAAHRGEPRQGAERLTVSRFRPDRSAVTL